MSYEFKDNRPMDLDLLAKMAKTFAAEYSATGLLAFSFDDGAAVHVASPSLSQVSPPSEWQWESDDHEIYPHTASTMHNGAKFFALFTDAGKQEVTK